MEKITETCIEMLQQRGYEITHSDTEKIIGVRIDDGSQICVFMINTPKFNVSLVEEYIVLMNELGINHSIIVYKNTITPFAKKVLTSCDSMTIELFLEDELQYNITKHRLVPLHEKLQDTEADEFKKKYGTKYPIILKTDPIARFYGYNRGDIIKITRKDNYVTYRIVK